MAGPTVTLEGVRLIVRNFEGRKKQYNKEGERNFGVIIPDENVARQMEADGFNVKWFEPREEDAAEGEIPTPWLPVKVAYDRGRPPRIVMITSRGPTTLNEDTVQELDWANILNVDVIIRGNPYDVNGRSGISAYVQTMIVVIEEDALEQKWADVLHPRSAEEPQDLEVQ